MFDIREKRERMRESLGGFSTSERRIEDFVNLYEPTQVQTSVIVLN